MFARSFLTIDCPQRNTRRSKRRKIIYAEENDDQIESSDDEYVPSERKGKHATVLTNNDDSEKPTSDNCSVKRSKKGGTNKRPVVSNNNDTDERPNSNDGSKMSILSKDDVSIESKFAARPIHQTANSKFDKPRDTGQQVCASALSTRTSMSTTDLQAIQVAITSNRKRSVALNEYVMFTPTPEDIATDKKAGYELTHNVGRVIAIRDISQSDECFDFEVRLEMFFTQSLSWNTDGAWHVWQQKDKSIIRCWISVEKLIVDSFGEILKVKWQNSKSKTTKKLTRKCADEITTLLNLYSNPDAGSSEFTKSETE